eukprot:SAG11_NODE_7294_length_1165_cov_1.299250_1_plen_42_part_10
MQKLKEVPNVALTHRVRTKTMPHVSTDTWMECPMACISFIRK